MLYKAMYTVLSSGVKEIHADSPEEAKRLIETYPVFTMNEPKDPDFITIKVDVLTDENGTAIDLK